MSTVTSSPPSIEIVVDALLRRVPGDVDAGANLDAALLERAADDTRDLGVTAGEDRRERLEDGDGRTHVGEQRRELTADGAPADDGRASWATRRGRGTRRR